MKGLQRIVCMLLVIMTVVSVMPVGVLSARNVYDDVKEEHWFYEPIMYVKDKGLMVGTKENAFSPFMTTNRAMLVTILHRLEGTPKAKKPMPFTDVKSDQYYAEAVAWASEAGIVAGTSPTTFDPNGQLTREQAARIFYSYATYKGYYEMIPGDLNRFSDAAKISSWAEFPMSWAVGIGLIGGMGDGTVSPRSTATRAQTATLLMNFCETITANAEIMYNVSFSMNDGGNAVYYNTFIPENGKVSAPGDPQRLKYNFTGWYTDSECTQKYNFSNTVTHSMTLYAGWSAEGDVEYNTTSGGYTEYQITDINMNGNTAAVTLNVNSKAVLTVDVYSSETNALIASESVETPEYCEMAVVSVPFDTELPEYFIVTATLYDVNSNILDSYQSIKNTEKYKEFDAQTVDSFPGKKVLNFDDDKTDNFAVLADGIIEINSTQSKNVLSVKYDYTNAESGLGEYATEYTFTKATTYVTSLEAGDKVYVKTPDGSGAIFKIKSITVDGTTVTVIPDDDTKLSDFYEVLKIHTSYSTDGPAARSVEDADHHPDWTEKLGASIELGKDVKLKGSITGTVTVTFDFVYDLKIFGEDYMLCGLTTETAVEMTGSLVYNGKTEFNLDEKNKFGGKLGLEPIKFPTKIPNLSVYAEVSVPFEWEVEAGATLTYIMSSKSGFKEETGNGRTDIDKKEQSFTPSLQGSITVKAGPKIALGLSFHEDLLKGELNAQFGIKITGEYAADLFKDNPLTNTASVHACDFCIKGDIKFFITVKAEISYEITDTWSGNVVDATLLNYECVFAPFSAFKGEFHFSLINESESIYKGEPDFGAGECENKKWKIIVNTYGFDGKLLNNSKVTVKNTDTGKVVFNDINNKHFYAYNGSYTASAAIQNVDTTTDFIVKDSATTVKMQADIIKLYTQFLVNGGYDSILTKTGFVKEWSSQSKWTIKTCLADTNNDGIKELLVTIFDYQTSYAILNVVNGKVVIMDTAYHSGSGSTGGITYSLKYDKNTSNYVWYKSNSHREGFAYYSLTTGIWSTTSSRIVHTMEYVRYVDDSNYNTTEYYYIDGSSRSKSAYDSELERYINPTNSAYTMYTGTYNKPIKSK